ncbi:Predicted arabinose efflux permease, MFS family [Halobiforma haloterrestris]|uniref:Predicted arabinose efflux permease, MFS family n=1 Tax=Natronobacterium haloterrestre TaxID=148448 RepID=A0A1I1EX99_NATHA|nr:MFS transporter [Halobiforma haloterrestris]SFB91724.1 Predicted arabinose efflux permease, MFS family [Halobiforma haloterrestris]
MSGQTDLKQGIREHLGQFSLHVLLVFATGLTIGSERTVVPVLGEDVLGVESFLVIGSFVVSFGFVKALLNLYAGKWGEEYGRKPVLVLGWITALPIPVILVFAPSWSWITVGNVLLGINQALTWSMAINAKIDLAGPEQRGLAVGIDEAFGYTGVAAGAWITGVIAGRTSLRPEPFVFLAAVVVLAFLISIFLIKETVHLARLEGDDDHHDANLPFDEVLKRATYGDRTLFAAAQAGHVENFVDTLFWIAVPLYLTSQGLAIEAVGVVVGVHSAMYFLQIGTGGLADRIGRRPPVVAGMFLAGAGVLGMVFVEGYLAWALLSAASGLGMALLYPNLMTVPSDAAHPTWRSAGMGVYRMWRDAGYGVGAILIGLSMEFVSAEAAFYVTAFLMFLSGAIVYGWMEETHPEFGTHEPPAPATEPAGGAASDD